MGGECFEVFGEGGFEGGDREMGEGGLRCVEGFVGLGFGRVVRERGGSYASFHGLGGVERPCSVHHDCWSNKLCPTKPVAQLADCDIAIWGVYRDYTIPLSYVDDSVKRL